MARLIDADSMRENWIENGENEYVYDTNAVLESIDAQPTVDAVEVIHGEWVLREKAGVDYWCCSVCDKIRSEYYDEPKDNYCPRCGADMREGRWKGEGMGDFSCSLCGEVVSGNHREKCPNCHAKMDGGDK